MTSRRCRTQCLTETSPPGRDAEALDGDSPFEEACDNGTPEEVRSYMCKTADALVVTDRAGRIVDVNDSWEYLCGYTLEEVKGRTSAFLQGTRTDPMLRAQLSRSVKEDYSIRRRVINYTKNGVEFMNNVTILPLRSIQPGGPAFVARLCSE